VPRLLELGVLARIDRAALADYCAAHSLAVNATKRYKREGIVVKTPYGPKPHPMIKIARESRTQANVLRAKFGLTPADRTRVGKPETPPGAAKSTDGTPLVGPGLRVVKGGGGAGG
jgi:P27 family predicted phage terminase small subunit